MRLVDVIVEKRRAIKEICAKHGATAVRIFGSCARNDWNDRSDVDVLVKMKKERSGIKSLARMVDIQTELEQLLGVDVDVVDEASLKGETRTRILKEAIAL